VWQHERATFPAVIAREGGRSSIPETPAMQSRGRGVLVTPHARGMTARSEAPRDREAALRKMWLFET
jgi:hypothetical protein